MTKAAKAEAALEAAEPEAEEEEAPPLGAKVERAKSGRSLCKECRLPIAEGALRIGADFIMDYGPAEGKVLVSWRHPACFSLPENECRTIEDLRGFSELSSAQQKAVREAIEGGMAQCGESLAVAEEAAEEEEAEEEEEEQPRARAPKKATKRKKEAAAEEEAKGKRRSCRARALPRRPPSARRPRSLPLPTKTSPKRRPKRRWRRKLPRLRRRRPHAMRRRRRRRRRRPAAPAEEELPCCC